MTTEIAAKLRKLADQADTAVVSLSEGDTGREFMSELQEESNTLKAAATVLEAAKPSLELLKEKVEALRVTYFDYSTDVDHLGASNQLREFRSQVLALLTTEASSP